MTGDHNKQYLEIVWNGNVQQVFIIEMSICEIKLFLHALVTT